MACAASADGAADRLRDRLGDELGDDGWLERTVFEKGRDPIWYCMLVHFVGPISDPEALVRWTDERNHVGIGTAMFDSMTLCSWRFDGYGMAPQPIASATCVS